MTVLITCIVVGILAWLFCLIDAYEPAVNCTVGVVILAACVWGSWAFLTEMLSPASGYTIATRNSPLVTLTDERSVTGGTFFLGSGVIGTDPSYTFYTEDGGYRTMHQENARTVKVYEDTDAPYAVWTDGCVPHHPALVWCFNRGSDTNRLVEIHVPAHSIKTAIVMGPQPHE